MLTQAQNKAATQPDYYVQPLSAFNIPAFIALQETIRPTLAQPYHLKIKTPEYLSAHLQSGMPIVGVFDKQGQLVAATILSDAASEVSKLHEYPVYDEQAQTIVMQSFMIHPDYQGRGLSHMMDGAAKKLLPEADFMAKIATDNHESLRSFEKRGFQCVEAVNSYDRDSNRHYKALFVMRECKNIRDFRCCLAAQAGVALRADIA
jgi:GNAT superfamily N-acetyltransferase